MSVAGNCELSVPSCEIISLYQQFYERPHASKPGFVTSLLRAAIFEKPKHVMSQNTSQFNPLSAESLLGEAPKQLSSFCLNFLFASLVANSFNKWLTALAYVYR